MHFSKSVHIGSVRPRTAAVIQQTDSLRCGEATAVASVHRTLAKSHLSNPATTTKSPTPNGVGLLMASLAEADLPEMLEEKYPEVL